MVKNYILLSFKSFFFLFCIFQFHTVEIDCIIILKINWMSSQLKKCNSNLCFIGDRIFSPSLPSSQRCLDSWLSSLFSLSPHLATYDVASIIDSIYPQNHWHALLKTQVPFSAIVLALEKLLPVL